MVDFFMAHSFLQGVGLLQLRRTPNATWKQRYMTKKQHLTALPRPVVLEKNGTKNGWQHCAAVLKILFLVFGKNAAASAAAAVDALLLSAMNPKKTWSVSVTANKKGIATPIQKNDTNNNNIFKKKKGTRQ